MRNKVGAHQGPGRFVFVRAGAATAALPHRLVPVALRVPRRVVLAYAVVLHGRGRRARELQLKWQNFEVTRAFWGCARTALTGRPVVRQRHRRRLQRYCCRCCCCWCCLHAPAGSETHRRPHHVFHKTSYSDLYFTLVCGVYFAYCIGKISILPKLYTNGGIQ